MNHKWILPPAWEILIPQRNDKFQSDLFVKLWDKKTKSYNEIQVLIQPDDRKLYTLTRHWKDPLVMRSLLVEWKLGEVWWWCYVDYKYIELKLIMWVRCSLCLCDCGIFYRLNLRTYIYVSLFYSINFSQRALSPEMNEYMNSRCMLVIYATTGNDVNSYICTHSEWFISLCCEIKDIPL